MIAAAILTGGQARRFQGRDKSRLPAWPGGPAILDHQLAALDPIAAEILIVTSQDRAASFSARATRPAVRVVVDQTPASGPLGAIVTALDATEADTLVVVAGDMPGLSTSAIRELLRLHGATEAEATVPESPRGLEPLCAIFARRSRGPLADAFEAGERSPQRALRTLRVNRVAASVLAPFDETGALFRNINSPDDL